MGILARPATMTCNQKLAHRPMESEEPVPLMGHPACEVLQALQTSFSRLKRPELGTARADTIPDKAFKAAQPYEPVAGNLKI